ncbi:hypothetical protein [Streptomyces sp. NPDC050560]|uniref:hypothetical protein n=1 Tax=Streptomyces sp. NPDC050560 TaxID=3365630 RepID=UPI00379FDB77
MSAHGRHNDEAATSARPGIDEAEASLVEHYPRLVRLAYLTLPPALGRHRRVLTAHALVQSVLPGRRADRGAARRGQRDSDGPAYDWTRARVLDAALAHSRHSGVIRRVWPRARRPLLPLVWGLRLFPRAGGGDELALDRALSAATAAARAALALRVLEELPEREVRDGLERAGVAEPDDALRAAARLASAQGGRAGRLLRTSEFDPCTVQTRPTDLLRRRHRGRLLGGAAAVVVAGALLAALLPREGGADDGRGPVTAGPPGAAAVDPARLRRAPADEWADSSRVDFSVWPARGDRTHDTALLGRALHVWSAPGDGVQVTAAPTTDTAPPAGPPQLLYAGELDGSAVVVFQDGVRVVRYAEPLSGGGAPALYLARADEADVTTAAAMVLDRSRGRARYLLAPWVAESTTRDLLAPDTPARALHVSDDGVTDAVPSPARGGDCGSWPVMQLRSSERIVERHAFLVTDLGDLSPVHLTYTPPPGTGQPARAPREATGGPALLSWAHTACTLRGLEGAGVRAVNNWAFAQQKLPDDGGGATWVCTRADTWRGPGRVLVQFQQPASSPTAPGTLVAKAKDTALCSRFGQHILADTHWKSPDGKWYVLAAGSRQVAHITVSGGAEADGKGTTLALAAPRDARVDVRGELSTGARLKALG